MTIISSDIDSQATAFTATANNQSIIVKPGVFVNSNGATGIATSSFTGVSVKNYGDVAGAVGVALAGTGAQLVNQAAGTIYGQSCAVSSQATSGSVINDGLIDGLVGVSSTGQGFSLINRGTIETTGDGIDLFAAGAILTNAGSIVSNAFGIQVNAGAAVTIKNSGLIGGVQAAIMSSGTGREIITNSGTLDGDVVLNDAANRLTNTGSIHGSVVLGNGGSVFNGRNGIVDGTITGGDGADKIIAGNDGETLAGGKGHDGLTGGNGADTFAFSSFNSADSDTIGSFNVNNDAIQLDHSVFTRLQADTTPSFTIGTASSSPTNYLFYNSGTGGLYYDVDGSASRAPYLVATLGAGLNLTASNFDVV